MTPAAEVLTDTARSVLRGAAKDVAALAGTFRSSPVQRDYALNSAILAARDQQLVKCDPGGWLLGEDTSSPAGRARVSRAYSDLEAAGLVERVRRRGRTTHLRITPAGFRLAKQLAADGAAQPQEER